MVKVIKRYYPQVNPLTKTQFVKPTFRNGKFSRGYFRKPKFRKGIVVGYKM